MAAILYVISPARKAGPQASSWRDLAILKLPLLGIGIRRIGHSMETITT